MLESVLGGKVEGTAARFTWAWSLPSRHLNLTETIRHAPHAIGVGKKETSPPAIKKTKEMFLEEETFHLGLASFGQT